MSESTCSRCGASTMMTVNVTGESVGACSEHFFEVMDEQVAALAAERGIPLDIARRLTARAIREALSRG